MRILSRFWVRLFWWFDVLGFFFWTVFLKFPTQETKSVKWRMILQIHFKSKPNGNALLPLHLSRTNKSKTETKPVSKAIASYFSVFDFQMESSTCVSPTNSQRQHHLLPYPPPKTPSQDFWLCPCCVRTPSLTEGSYPSQDFVSSCFSHSPHFITNAGWV